MRPAVSPEEWAADVRGLGLALQRARRAAGLTQEEVAHASELTRSHYQQLEKGQSRPGVAANPSLKTLVNLARTLEVDVRDLIDSALDTR